MSAIAATAFTTHDSYLSALTIANSYPGFEADQRANWSDSLCTLFAAITWNTPESIAEVQPVLHTPSGVVVVADCRLDNPKELLASLPEDREAAHGDCDLILRAWLRWGEACVNHLLGDFAFALWDPRIRVLFCACDPFGCRPLYYARIGRGVLVATEPATILVHPAVDRGIRAEWLAESVARTFGAGLETPFAAVKRLPGGHSITVRERGVSEREYWRPQPGSLAGLGTERAIIEEGRHLLAESVACRLRTAWPVGAELTGGIDSGGIVATALPMLRHKGQDVAVFSRLRAASHAFLGPDESPGVASLCEHLGIRRRFVSNCTGPGLLDLLDRMLDRHAIPLCRWSIFSEEMRTLAARQGIRTMLSGFAGDNCFSAPEYSLPATEPWLHNWQWRWQHQRALAQRNQNGRAVKPFARAVLATLAPRLNQRRTTPLKITPLGATPLRITPGLDSDSAGPLHNRQLHFRIASGALLAAPHKQAWTYPLLDRRLIEFALACPPQIRTAQGFSRRLARLVIDDRVPASVAWNPRKGRETIPGSREQVVDNGDAIRARLEGWRGHPLVSSVFDLEQAAADARRPSTETAQHWVAEAGRVVDILHIGEFLTRHVEAGMQAFQTLRAG